ncbi:MAG: DEAD/DEAH box helicase [Burkholderiales bacterium]
MKFSELGLNSALLRALDDEGYTDPTQIQVESIPIVLAGRDVMAGAQTGTGKTAAFTLPLLQQLLIHANISFSPARHPVRALILVPTRELAVQVEASVRAYGRHVALRSTTVYGGMDMQGQTDMLRRGVEIVVATPGRLLDHVQQKNVNLGTTEILVLDEADRMLDMGFMPDIKRILDLLPKDRQNLLFSATFPDEVKKLAAAILTDPVTIQVAKRNSAAETITQVIYRAPHIKKRGLLVDLLTMNSSTQALVFCNTKHGASRLARELEREGMAAAAIHSDRSQAERLQTLGDFKNGQVRVLVGTDVAARGLDIEELPFVINYDIPFAAEDYIHRIGRTGRAGIEGNAISLMAPDEERLVADIEKLLKRSIEKLEFQRTPRLPPESARIRSAPVEIVLESPSVLLKPVSSTDPLISSPERRVTSRPAPRKEIAALLGGLKKTPQNV